MNDAISIRKITASDKPRLLEIMTAFYNSPALLHHTPEAVLSRTIDDCASDLPFLVGYVATNENDDILGYTMLSVGYSTEYGGICITVEDLCVVPEARGKHIGEKLLSFVCELYGKSAVRIRLEVAPENTGAVRFYERFGFTDIEYKQMGIVFDTNKD